MGIRRPFSDFKDLVPANKKWRDYIDPNLMVEVVTYDHGKIIVDSTGKATDPRLTSNHMAIVVGGIAELTEEYEIIPSGDVGVTCYRPIRLLEVGDLFNDFSIVDRYSFETKPVSRPGESWKLRSGRRSCYVILKEESSRMGDFIDDAGRHVGHKFLEKKFPQTCSVAYVYLEESSKHFPDLIRELMRNAWRRAYTYRASSNSYNIAEKLAFRYDALRATRYLRDEEVGRKPNKKYPDKVNRYEITEALLDAIHDAINRPERDEPLFAEDPTLSHPIGRVLVSARPSKTDAREFYFPIGRSNFLIAKHANAANRCYEVIEGLTISEARPPRADSNGEYPKSEALEGGPHKGNGMYFWREVARLIVAKHQAQHGASPWRLSVEALRVSDNAFELFMVYRR